MTCSLEFTASVGRILVPTKTVIRSKYLDLAIAVITRGAKMTVSQVTRSDSGLKLLSTNFCHLSINIPSKEDEDSGVISLTMMVDCTYNSASSIDLLTALVSKSKKDTNDYYVYNIEVSISNQADAVAQLVLIYSIADSLY